MYIRIYFGGLGGGVWISDIHTFGGVIWPNSGSATISGSGNIWGRLTRGVALLDPGLISLIPLGSGGCYLDRSHWD